MPGLSQNPNSPAAVAERIAQALGVSTQPNAAALGLGQGVGVGDDLPGGPNLAHDWAQRGTFFKRLNAMSGAYGTPLGQGQDVGVGLDQTDPLWQQIVDAALRQGYSQADATQMASQMSVSDARATLGTRPATTPSVAGLQAPAPPPNAPQVAGPFPSTAPGGYASDPIGSYPQPSPAAADAAPSAANTPGGAAAALGGGTTGANPSQLQPMYDEKGELVGYTNPYNGAFISKYQLRDPNELTPEQQAIAGRSAATGERQAANEQRTGDQRDREITDSESQHAQQITLELQKFGMDANQQNTQFILRLLELAKLPDPHFAPGAIYQSDGHGNMRVTPIPFQQEVSGDVLQFTPDPAHPGQFTTSTLYAGPQTLAKAGYSVVGDEIVRIDESGNLVVAADLQRPTLSQQDDGLYAVSTKSDGTTNAQLLIPKAPGTTLQAMPNGKGYYSIDKAGNIVGRHSFDPQDIAPPEPMKGADGRWYTRDPSNPNQLQLMGGQAPEKPSAIPGTNLTYMPMGSEYVRRSGPSGNGYELARFDQAGAYDLSNSHLGSVVASGTAADLQNAAKGAAFDPQTNEYFQNALNTAGGPYRGPAGNYIDQNGYRNGEAGFSAGGQGSGPQAAPQPPSQQEQDQQRLQQLVNMMPPVDVGRGAPFTSPPDSYAQTGFMGSAPTDSYLQTPQSWAAQDTNPTEKSANDVVPPDLTPDDEKTMWDNQYDSGEGQDVGWGHDVTWGMRDAPADDGQAPSGPYNGVGWGGDYSFGTVGSGADAGWTSPVPADQVVGTGHKFGDPVSMEGVHKGLDLQAYQGTPVVAPVDGTVTDIKNEPAGLGLQVIVQGRDGVQHKMSHLQKADVRIGQPVKMGEPVATVGSSGAGSTGPHLDYRMMQPSQDGMLYLNPEPLAGPLAQMPRADNGSEPPAPQAPQQAPQPAPQQGGIGQDVGWGGEGNHDPVQWMQEHNPFQWADDHLPGPSNVLHVGSPSGAQVGWNTGGPGDFNPMTFERALGGNMSTAIPGVVGDWLVKNLPAPGDTQETTDQAPPGNGQDVGVGAAFTGYPSGTPVVGANPSAPAYASTEPTSSLGVSAYQYPGYSGASSVADNGGSSGGTPPITPLQQQQLYQGEQGIGISQQNANTSSAAQAANANNQAATLDYNNAALAQTAAQFQATYGLDIYKVWQSGDQFSQNLALQQSQLSQQHDYQTQTLQNQATQIANQLANDQANQSLQKQSQDIQAAIATTDLQYKYDSLTIQNQQFGAQQAQQLAISGNQQATQLQIANQQNDLNLQKLALDKTNSTNQYQIQLQQAADQHTQMQLTATYQQDQLAMDQQKVDLQGKQINSQIAIAQGQLDQQYAFHTDDVAYKNASLAIQAQGQAQQAAVAQAQAAVEAQRVQVEAMSAAATASYQQGQLGLATKSEAFNEQFQQAQLQLNTLTANTDAAFKQAEIQNSAVQTQIAQQSANTQAAAQQSTAGFQTGELANQQQSNATAAAAQQSTAAFQQGQLGISQEQVDIARGTLQAQLDQNEKTYQLGLQTLQEKLQNDKDVNSFNIYKAQLDDARAASNGQITQQIAQLQSQTTLENTRLQGQQAIEQGGTFGQKAALQLETSALNAPWLQQLSGMTPGYGTPGGPGWSAPSAAGWVNSITQPPVQAGAPGPTSIPQETTNGGAPSSTSAPQGSSMSSSGGQSLGAQMGGASSMSQASTPSSPGGGWSADSSSLPSWSQFQSMTPFQRAGMQTQAGAQGVGPAALGSALVNNFAKTGGPTTAPDTTQLSAAKQSPLDKAGTEQVASVFGQDPTSYWQGQSRGWAKAGASQVSQAA